MFLCIALEQESDRKLESLLRYSTSFPLDSVRLVYKMKRNAVSRRESFAEVKDNLLPLSSKIFFISFIKQCFLEQLVKLKKSASEIRECAPQNRNVICFTVT